MGAVRPLPVGDGRQCRALHGRGRGRDAAARPVRRIVRIPLVRALAAVWSAHGGLDAILAPLWPSSRLSSDSLAIHVQLHGGAVRVLNIVESQLRQDCGAMQAVSKLWHAGL